MLKTLSLNLPREMYERLETAARGSQTTVTNFVRDVIESDLAARKLAVLPPIPRGPGGKPDIFERLNMK